MAFVRHIGAPVPRREDAPLIQGGGTYVDDVPMPRALHAAFLRSDLAHARIRSLDVAAARSRQGVLLVVTGEDVVGRIGTIPCKTTFPGLEVPTHHALALGKVCFVGQPIAMVIADDPYVARDAVEAIRVDLEPLPAVIDAEAAARPDAPRIHEELPSNVAFRACGPTPTPQSLYLTEAPTKPLGITDAAFARADRTVEFRLAQPRLHSFPMEPRAVVAKAEAGTGRLTVWVSTQFPHTFRTLLAEALSLPESDVHVIAPDVGGGFGCKLQLYPEELLVPWAARQLRRPVRWVETRREHLAATVHGRGQAQEIKVGFNNDGRIIALKAKIFCDLGAYLYFFTPVIPRFTGFIMNGCYDIEALEFEVIGCFTNKIATDAYRGAGRPEAICIAERVVEVVAEALDLDPVEVRRRNFIKQFPARTATGFVYENGDYHASLDRLLAMSSYDALRRDQARQRADGRLVGLGLATYMEVGGLAPSRMRAPNLGGWESCTIRVDPTGSVTVLTGASPHGQGLATAFSQIVADELGVALGTIRVLHGDTDVVPYGNGTMGSRSLAIGGGALLMSLSKVKDKARRVAALLLEAEPDGITYDGGGLFVTDRPEKKVSFAEVAARANDFKFEQPTTGLEPGLEATSRYEPETVTYPFGAHLAMVEIDPETGEVRLLRYYGVDDCGRVINPLIVEGQVHGGIAQGVGQVLFEHMVYDETGQLLSGTLMDYAIPRADTMPPVLVLEHMETLNLRNPLGVKGAGEAGTIGAVSAVYNAILDALAPRGVRQGDMPLLPRRVWDLLHTHAHLREGDRR